MTGDSTPPPDAPLFSPRPDESCLGSAAHGAVRHSGTCRACPTARVAAGQRIDVDINAAQAAMDRRSARSVPSKRASTPPSQRYRAGASRHVQRRHLYEEPRCSDRNRAPEDVIIRSDRATTLVCADEALLQDVTVDSTDPGIGDATIQCRAARPQFNRISVTDQTGRAMVLNDTADAIIRNSYLESPFSLSGISIRGGATLWDNVIVGKLPGPVPAIIRAPMWSWMAISSSVRSMSSLHRVRTPRPGCTITG